MVYKYVRKTDRGKGWDKDSMELAFKAVRVDKVPIRQAAAKHNIPYPTLRKHLIKNSTEQVILGT